MSVLFSIFREKLFLGFQTVKLVRFIRGDTAVGSDIHIQQPLCYFKIFLLHLYYIFKT